VVQASPSAPFPAGPGSTDRDSEFILHDNAPRSGGSIKIEPRPGRGGRPVLMLRDNDRALLRYRLLHGGQAKQ
jgi:hypothetical protein